MPAGASVSGSVSYASLNLLPLALLCQRAWLSWPRQIFDGDGLFWGPPPLPDPSLALAYSLDSPVLGPPSFSLRGLRRTDFGGRPTASQS